MDSLIFDLQIVVYFQLFLSANVRYRNVKTLFQSELDSDLAKQYY